MPLRWGGGGAQRGGEGRWGGGSLWRAAEGLRPSALLPAPPALQRLRGTADVAQELSELDEERAACRGQRARRPWELLHDRGLRRQVTSLAVLGGALELCGNDSVSPASPPRAAAERRQPQPGPPLRPPFPGVRSRLLGVPGGRRPRRGGPVRRRGHRELRAAGGLRVGESPRSGLTPTSPGGTAGPGVLSAFPLQVTVLQWGELANIY